MGIGNATFIKQVMKVVEFMLQNPNASIPKFKGAKILISFLCYRVLPGKKSVLSKIYSFWKGFCTKLKRYPVWTWYKIVQSCNMRAITIIKLTDNTHEVKIKNPLALKILFQTNLLMPQWTKQKFKRK